MTEVDYNVLDLFAGIGGASYAGKLIGGWRTVCYVEWDKYCQQVIRARIKDGIFDDAPIWGDIITFDGKPWCGSVDIVTAGFPCQPFSVAGKRLGEADERNMWPETFRVIGEVRPRYAFLENVPALLTSGYFGRIIGDLSEIGYDCRWTIVSAADVGAPHLRKRLWILAYPESDDARGMRSGRQATKSGPALDSQAPNTDNDEPRTIRWWDTDPADLPDTDSLRFGNALERQEAIRQSHCRNQSEEIGTESKSIPFVGRVADGIPDRCDRLKGLGNAWVPLVAATAWERLFT